MNTTLARRRTAASLLLAAVTAAGLALVGCAGASDTAPETSSPAAEETISGELTIFAAASLSNAFDELSAEFSGAHPGVDVLPITYDGSSTLATQISGGASVDVFASADENNMENVADLAADPQTFATNTLEIAVAPGNPTGITGLADLADANLLVVLCAPEVPCGNASHTLLDDDGVTVAPVSEEQNVTAVLAKVKSGEADAGLVYKTDVTAAGDEVEGVEIEGADRATNVCPLTVLEDSANPDAAQAFVDFILSAEGQAVLKKYGFGAP